LAVVTQAGAALNRRRDSVNRFTGVQSFLVESEAILDNTNTLFWRSELVQKSAEELVVDSPTLTSGGVLLPGFPGTQHFNVATAQLGYIRELARTHWATIGLGAAGTLNFMPSPLGPYYGSRTPPYPPIKLCVEFCITSFDGVWPCRTSPTCRHTASGSRSYAPKLSSGPAYWHSLRIPGP